jgi:succinate-semialdehyde dehydrogenase / glutarate-semialdehyde dehydrogenase
VHVQALLFVDGSWRGGIGGHTRDLINPATEAVIGRVACADPADLDEAIASARRSFGSWRGTAVKDRAAILLRAADALEQKVPELAAALTREQGKLIVESEAEWARTVETLRWNAKQAESLCSDRPAASADSRSYVAPEPIGIVAAFTPWNYPAVVSARKLAPALAAGCPVILKTAEEAPSSAIAIVEALSEAGLPRGVVSLVSGDPPTISRHLLASPYVRALTFTGSTVVGKELARLGSDTLKRCILELGGHSAVLVFADADLDAAAQAIAAYKFECAGQSCNAPSRIFVHASVHDRFAGRFCAIARNLRVGDGAEKGSEMGPMANPRRLSAMDRLIRDAIVKGARIVTGGRRLDRLGYFWAPTVLTQVPDDAVIMTEEPFGPIAPIVSFTTIDEAVARANANPYGLASYVFTGSPDVADVVARRLDAGSIGVNQLKGVPPDASVGGIKDSGYGYEGGVAGLEAFLNLKLVSRAL